MTSVAERPAAEDQTEASTAMLRSGVALIASALVLTVSGFGFWLIVGQGLDDRSLGEVAGLTSLILFLSGITRLNMAASLPAVLPGAGYQGRILLSQAYTTAVAVGVAASVALVIWTAVFQGSVAGLERSQLWVIPLFVSAWSLFSLQDGALTAAGASNLVAIENLAYSVARLVLAAALMVATPTVSSALAAWFAPLLLFIPGVNVLLWRRYQGPSKAGWDGGDFTRLVAFDFLGSVAVLASTRGFAYLALITLPEDTGGDLAVAWLFFITIDVVFLQASNALTAEASRTPQHRTRLTRSAALMASALGLVGGLVGVVATPLLIRLLIDEPTSELIITLRLIFVALAARPILHVWLARARAGRSHMELTVGPAVAFVLFALGVAPGLVADDMVLVGIGVAASQWIVAVLAWISLQFPDPVALAGAPTAERDTSTRNRTDDTNQDSDEDELEQLGFQRIDEIGATRTKAIEELAAGARGRRTTRIIQLAWGALAVGSGLLLVSVPAVDYDLVDGLGLIRALPPIYWLSLTWTTVAFLVFIAYRARHGAAAATGVFVVTLHGIEPLSAPAARFSVAWLISGFSEVIARTGAPERLIDARFSWPGFYFGPAAAMSGRRETVLINEPGSFTGPAVPATAGEQLLNIDPLLRFWPLGVFAVWVLLVWTLTRLWFPYRWVAAPVAAWMFTLAAWTGQNYFSPQSMGTTVTAILVLLIAMVEVELPRQVPLRTRLSWIVTPSSEDAPRAVGLTVLILALAASIIVTHPLSPVFLTLWLIPLAMAGYRYARGMPVIVFVAFLTWVSGAARPWWRSRIASLIDNVGAVGSTVSESTSARAADASFDRTLVLLSRMGIVLTVGAFSLVAAYYLWRQRGQIVGLVLLGMAALPGLAVAGQPYGGEILVRVFLFSVFPAAILFGAALAYIGSRPLLIGSIAMLTVIGAPVLIINRYGNESYEMTSETDRRAIAAVYQQAPPDTLFMTDDPFLSWGYTRIERVDGFRNHQYLRRLTDDEETVRRAADAARVAGYDYVAIITAESQEAWGEQTVGRPENWLTDVASYLEANENVTTLYRDGASGAFLIQVSRVETGDNP